MIRRVAFALFVGGALVPSGASAQDQGAPNPDSIGTPDPLYRPIPTDPSHPNYNPNAHRSIVRHNPLPRRTSYNSYYPYRSSGSQAGFSTGGVGRYAEFYDPNTPRSQVDQHPVPVAQFDKGGGPDRAEQIAAAEGGQQRARNIQNNINAYAQPRIGYGIGFGGGALYNFPN